MQICNIRKTKSKAKRINASLLIHEYFNIKKKPKFLLEYGKIRISKHTSIVYSLWNSEIFFDVRIFLFDNKERTIYDLDLKALNISQPENYRFDTCKKARKYISTLEEYKSNAYVKEINNNLGYITVFYPLYNREYYITDKPYLDMCDNKPQYFIDYLFNIGFFELVHTNQRGL